MSRKVIATSDAPAAIGPYSQAIESDGFFFSSGQLGLDPATGKLVDGIDNQAERALLNLEAVLGEAGLTMADVVKTTIYLVDLSHFAQMNAIYSRHVIAPPPARSTVQVAGLALGALIEIEVVARRSS
jgi:2-iminobutanoate/2-iminopropanoate deaminase